MKTKTIVSLFLAGLFVTCIFVPQCTPKPDNRPVVGISSQNNDSELGASATYFKAVEAAGGRPVLVDLSTDEVQLEQALDGLDALVMTGGPDFDPMIYYGEEPIPEMGRIDSLRDEFDVKLVRLAVERGLPVLGICRGEQLLGVAFGGSLIQDIPVQVSALADTLAGDPVIVHNQGEQPGNEPSHSIAIDADSKLAALLGTTTADVNSFHHQAINRVPEGFKVTARAADGVIEAIEPLCDTVKVLGVQFHPEMFTASGDTTFIALFRWLVSK